MPADRIQADYDQLERIARRFEAASCANDEMVQRTRQAVDALRNGAWVGKGSAAFLTEVDQRVYPALDRLTAALVAAEQTTRQVSLALQTAEREAAALFQAGGAAAASPAAPGNGTTGSGGPSTGLGPGGGPSGSAGGPVAAPGSGRTIWDFFRAEGTQFTLGRDRLGAGGTTIRELNPEIKATIGIPESSVWGDPKKGLAGVGGYVEAGARVNVKDGLMIGGGGEFYAVKGEWDTALVGDKEWGLTGSVGFRGLGVQGFGGAQIDRHDVRLGGSVGANAVSGQFGLGANVAGVNVAGTLEAGLKWEFGVEIGKRTRIRLPLVSVGLRFGEGVE